MRMRRTAKRALKGPLRPPRQLIFFPLAFARIVSAATGSRSGIWFLRGRPRFATEKIRKTLAG